MNSFTVYNLANGGELRSGISLAIALLPGLAAAQDIREDYDPLVSLYQAQQERVLKKGLQAVKARDFVTALNMAKEMDELLLLHAEHFQSLFGGDEIRLLVYKETPDWKNYFRLASSKTVRFVYDHATMIEACLAVDKIPYAQRLAKSIELPGLAKSVQDSWKLQKTTPSDLKLFLLLYRGFYFLNQSSDLMIASKSLMEANRQSPGHPFALLGLAQARHLSGKKEERDQELPILKNLFRKFQEGPIHEETERRLQSYYPKELAELKKMKKAG